jgi:hypothetical protein
MLRCVFDSNLLEMCSLFIDQVVNNVNNVVVVLHVQVSCQCSSILGSLSL